MASALTLVAGAVVVAADGGATVRAEARSVAFTGCSPAVVAGLTALSEATVTDETLAALGYRLDGHRGFVELFAALQRLREEGLLAYGVRCGSRPVLTAVPHVTTFVPDDVVVDAGTTLVLSRFACLHREGRDLVCESPLSPVTIVVHEPQVMAVLSQCAQPIRRSQIAALPDPELDATVDACLNLLWATRMLAVVGPDGCTAEDHAGNLRSWEFHDLLFHSRSRLGRHNRPYGATFRFGKTRSESGPPAAAQASARIPLARPDLVALGQKDVPFTTVLEGRRSRRRYAEQPIGIREVGELLFRSARARPGTESGETTRVFPSGGGIYELEIYLVVSRCEGLAPGLFRYIAAEHELERRADLTPATGKLLADAGRAASVEPPAMLLVLAARFERVAWKYSAMAYATVLKDAGVVLNTFSLVAEAMGLAGCPLGGGDSDAFAAAAGTDYYEETSVAEFMIGRRQSGEATATTSV